MLSQNPAYVNALLGGILIGVASWLAASASGKIPGISGVFSRILRPWSDDTRWRAAFLVGLVAGAAVAFGFVDAAATFRPGSSLVVTAVAGLLVGFGTRLGGGCTSGHGVCGLGLGSKSALVATVLFMAAGMLTVWLVRHGLDRL